MPHALAHQQAYFERLAGRYADGYAISVPFLQRIRGAASPHVTGRVLDIGNGGLATWELRRADAAVFVDLCPGSLRTPRTIDDAGIRPLRVDEADRVRRVGADALALPFAAGSFDTVVMFYVAHHLSVASRRGCRANVHRAFTEVHRVLRPGGSFLLLENIPSAPVKLAQELGFGLGFRILGRIGKPLPYFLSRRQILHLLGDAFVPRDSARIAWCPRVHQPLFPRWAPPGRVWERVLANRLEVLERA